MLACRSQGSAVSTNLQRLVEVLLRFGSLSFGLCNAWRQVPERRLHMANRRSGYAVPVYRRRRCTLRLCGRGNPRIILGQCETAGIEQRESCKSGDEYRFRRQLRFPAFSLLSIHGLLLQYPRMQDPRMKSWAGGRGETTGPGLRPKLNPGDGTDSSVTRRMRRVRGRTHSMIARADVNITSYA